MPKDASVQEILKETLLKMSVSFEDVEVEDDGIGITRFNVVSPTDSRVLIGPHGEHLQALNAVIKRMVEAKEKPEELSFIIDVNDYQKQRIDNLRNQTKIIAERVKLFEKEMSLPAMSSYERMIVHAIAQSIEGISTRSEGVGRERYVVIAPQG